MTGPVGGAEGAGAGPRGMRLVDRTVKMGQSLLSSQPGEEGLILTWTVRTYSAFPDKDCSWRCLDKASSLLLQCCGFWDSRGESQGFTLSGQSMRPSARRPMGRVAGRSEGAGAVCLKFTPSCDSDGEDPTEGNSTRSMCEAETPECA